MQEEDKLVWIKERSESYSVKLGYSVAFQIFHTPIDTLLAQCNNKKLWKALWEMWVPPKVKNLVWKLIHERLPVRQKLQSRIATVDDKCPRCDTEGESLQHCFISCPHSLQVWIVAGFSPNFGAETISPSGIGG